MTTAAHRADMITELEEVVVQLASDARAAESNAEFQLSHDTMHETPRMQAAREAYARAIGDVAVAARAYSDAVQHSIDNLRGVR